MSGERQSLAALERVSPLPESGGQSSISAGQMLVEEQISGAPLIGGNQVTLLTDGPATYASMLQAIGKARHLILLESYILDNDAIGERFAKALIERRRAGVTVALMVDSLGTLSTPREFFQKLSDEGVKVVHFNSLNPVRRSFGWNINERDHRKVLVVDGVVGFTGGLNLSEVYSSRPGSRPVRRKETGKEGDGEGDSDAPWRDTHVRISGPAAMALQRAFMQGWEEQDGEALSVATAIETASAVIQDEPPGKDLVRIVTTSPDEGSPIYRTLLAAITRAQKSVHITMAYFVPTSEFREALGDAARRGVDVKLVLPGFSDFWMVFHAGRAHYTELLRSGVRIYERRDALLHAKTAVIDGVWSTVGSSNIDWRSFAHNHELNAIVLGPAFGSEMEALFEKDCRISAPVLLDDWLDRSWRFVMLERTAWLFSYWL